MGTLRIIINSITTPSSTGTLSTMTWPMFSSTRCMPPTLMPLRQFTISSCFTSSFVFLVWVHTHLAIHDHFIAHDLDVLRTQQLPSQT